MNLSYDTAYHLTKMCFTVRQSPRFLIRPSNLQLQREHCEPYSTSPLSAIISLLEREAGQLRNTANRPYPFKAQRLLQTLFTLTLKTPYFCAERICVASFSKYTSSVGTEVLMAVATWDVTPCSMTEVYRRFEERIAITFSVQ
jgi:hypothetical protein